MLTIRWKMVFGFGGLLLVLLVVSGMGLAVLNRYSSAVDEFLKENFRSVQYGQEMREATDRLHDAALASVSGDIASAHQLAEPALAEFSKSLDDENHNITLHPHEDELAAALTKNWASYQHDYQPLLDAKSTTDQKSAALNTINQLTQKLKADAQDVIRINLENMVVANGQVKTEAKTAQRLMILLSGAGALLAALFIAVVARSILRPLADVTTSAKEIERGNLDLTVAVRSRDEVGQLAEAFNSMAAKLRELRRTDRAMLVRTQRTTQLALGSLPDAVAIVNPDGKIELANETARKLFGLQPGSVIDTVAAGALAQLYRNAASERRTIHAKGYDAAIQIFNGQERFFIPTAVPIIDEERTLVGVTLVLADVTNLRKLDEMKSGLLSVVSHELKTPLTSIRMATHLLLEERVGALNAKQIELLVAAREDADRLYEIIENLLDMSRIESGRALIELRSVPSDRLVSDALEDVRVAYRDKGVALESNAPADIPPVLADPERISHVFGNLLGNALKFTPAGGTVRIEAEATDDVVRFSVSDTGPGIPTESLPRVFERFYRAPGNTTGGAGLGLAIAKEIVEVHGGSISATSTAGSGSRFSFTLNRADRAAVPSSSTQNKAEVTQS